MSIIIVTDTSSDMDSYEYTEKNITCIPLPVTFGETTYDRIDKDLFFQKLTSAKEFPHTSQPSPEVFLQLFSKAKENGDTLIVILLSSALSGTFQSAVLAKNMVEYDNIHLIDSRTATVAVKLLVDHAAAMRDAGCTAEEIVAAVNALVPRTRILAVVDTLEYLYKGGRLTRAQAGFGTLAHLKPLITLDRDGTVQVIGKEIGKNRSIQALIRELSAHRPDTDHPILLIYSQFSDNCMAMKEKILQQLPELPLPVMMNIGATIGTHIGPRAYGIVYIEKN